MIHWAEEICVQSIKAKKADEILSVAEFVFSISNNYTL